MNYKNRIREIAEEDLACWVEIDATRDLKEVFLDVEKAISEERIHYDK
jgi:hypothetical protein